MNYAEAEALIERELFAEAGEMLNEHLIYHPDDARALYYMGNVLLETGKPTLAEAVYERADMISPGRWMIRCNLARAYADQFRYQEAYDLWLDVLRTRPDEPAVLNSLASAALQLGRPRETIEWSAKTLARNPTDEKAHCNLGFAYLALGDYARGWYEYQWGQGHLQWRDFKQYAGEPLWSGEPGTVVAYGEQGLGDQILLANAVHDLCARAGTTVILECHRKLAGLFRRSFPEAEVYGTQTQPMAELYWPGTHQIDASISTSQLQAHFRSQPEAWTGRRYLNTCDVRAGQWASHFRGQRVVGIAWTAGMVGTDMRRRSTGLEGLLPVLRLPGIEWVSLEHKDRSEEIQSFEREQGIKIHSFPWATRSPDLDDAAALIDALDAVVAPPSTSIHLAGALEVPAHCIAEPVPHCFWGLEGERVPYYRSVRLYRREGDDWGPAAERVALALHTAMKEAA